MLGIVGAAVLGGLVFGSASTAAEGAAMGWYRFAGFAAVLGASLWFWSKGQMATSLAAATLMVVSVADLWVIDRQFFETMDPPAVAFRSDDVTDFLQTQEGPFRVWVMNLPQLGGAYRGHGNYPMRFGIEQASGEHGNQLTSIYYATTRDCTRRETVIFGID